MDFWAPLPLVCILCKQVPFRIDLISFSPRTFRCFTNLHLWTHWSAKFERLFSLQHVFSIRQNHPKTSNIYFPSPEVGYQEFCELSGISYDVKVKVNVKVWWNKARRRTWGAHVAPSIISSGWISPFLEIPLLCQMSIFIAPSAFSNWCPRKNNLTAKQACLHGTSIGRCSRPACATPPPWGHLVTKVRRPSRGAEKW